MKEVDAANIILGEAGDGEQFKLRWGWLRFRLSIKPVSTKTLIRISREVAEIPEIDPSGDAFQEDGGLGVLYYPQIPAGGLNSCQRTWLVVPACSGSSEGRVPHGESP